MKPYSSTTKLLIACGLAITAASYGNPLPAMRGAGPQVRELPAFFSGIGAPEGLAYDRAGNLYAADERTNSIKMLTPAGEVTTFQTGLMLGHAGMVFDSLGHLYAADEETGGKRGMKLTPDTGSEVGGSSLDEDHPLVLETENAIFDISGNATGVLSYGEPENETRLGAGVPGSHALAEDFVGRIYVANDATGAAKLGAIGRFTEGALPMPEIAANSDISSMFEGWEKNPEDMLTKELRRKKNRESGGNSKTGAASAFGRELSMITHSQAAPEPTSMALIALGAMALVNRRRRMA